MAVYAEASGGEPLAVLALAGVTAREARIAGTLPEGAAWAELVSAPPPEPLVLAAPVRADPGDGRDYAAWTAALPPPGPRPEARERAAGTARKPWWKFW